MIDHTAINVSDIAASSAFYDSVLATLGHRRVKELGPEHIGYGTDAPQFWIHAGPVAEGPNREMHVAFAAPSAAVVRAWFEAAVAAGAEVLNEPRMWPDYHPGYYGAFVRDPDGNNVEAVCHTAGADD